jgi:hypothetical protein
MDRNTRGTAATLTIETHPGESVFICDYAALRRLLHLRGLDRIDIDWLKESGFADTLRVPARSTDTYWHEQPAQVRFSLKRVD